MKTLSRPFDVVLAALMAAVALTGVWLFFRALTNDTSVLASAGFEAVIVFTGLAGVVFALGKAREGRSVGLLNLGGVLFVAAITARFAWHTTVNPQALGVRASVQFAATDPWFLLRGGIGLALVAWSVLLALGSDSVGWRRLIIGTALSVPLLAGTALGFMKGFGTLFPAMTDTLTAIRLVGGIAVTLVFCVMFSIGVHLVIKAFELAGPANDLPQTPTA